MSLHDCRRIWRGRRIEMEAYRDAGLVEDMSRRGGLGGEVVGGIGFAVGGRSVRRA